MKTMKFLMMTALMLGIATAGFAGNPGAEFGFSTSTKVRAMAASRSIMFKQPLADPAVRATDKCATYRRVQVSGIVLLATGAASMMTGGIIAAAYYHTHVNDEVPPRNVRYFGPGVGLFAFGTFLAASGTALTIAGTVKRHRYCGSAAPSQGYIISPSNKGVGMAMKF